MPFAFQPVPVLVCYPMYDPNPMNAANRVNAASRVTRLVGHPFVVYTVGRFAVFAAMAAALYLLGFRSWALAFAALLLSMPASYVVLRPLRKAFARELERRRDERRERARLDDDADDTPARPDAPA
jgi:Protein of unknown function (DUF4229)